MIEGLKIYGLFEYFQLQKNIVSKMREPIVVSLFLLLVLLNVSVTQIGLQKQIKTSTSNSSSITTRGDDGYILVILLGFMCVIISTQVFLFLPYLNIKIQKVPIVLIFMIIAKDSILLIFYNQAGFLTKVLFNFMGFIVQISCLIYNSRQIQIVGLKKQNSWNIQPIIQTLLVFYTLSFIFRDAFATKIWSLEFQAIMIAELTLLIMLILLALWIYKQNIFKEEVNTNQNQQEGKQCKLLKSNNSLLSIHIFAKINSVSYSYLVFFLIFSGAIQLIQYYKLNSLQNKINDTQLNLKSIYGFGCLLSLALFNIFLKRSINLSAKIILIANIVVDLLIQLGFENLTFTVILVVLAGLFQNLIIVWVFHVILLVLQVKYQEIALFLTWKFIGSMIIYFSKTIFLFSEDSIIIELIFTIGIFAILFLKNFHEGTGSFYGYLKGQQERISRLSVKNDKMEVQIKNQFMPSSNIKLDQDLKYAHLQQQKD